MPKESFYVGVKDVMALGFGRNKAYELIHLVRDEYEKEGYFLPAALKAPREGVLKKMGVKKNGNPEKSNYPAKSSYEKEETLSQISN